MSAIRNMTLVALFFCFLHTPVLAASNSAFESIESQLRSIEKLIASGNLDEAQSWAYQLQTQVDANYGSLLVQPAADPSGSNRRQMQMYQVALKSVLLQIQASLAAVKKTPSSSTSTTSSSETKAEKKYVHCNLHPGADHLSLPCDGGSKELNEGIASKRAITERTQAPLPIWSAMAGKGAAEIAIDLDKRCRWVDSNPDINSGLTKDLFIPFRTTEEWEAFDENHPKELVSLRPCSRPGPVMVPPNDPAKSDRKPPALREVGCFDSKGQLQAQTLPWSGISLYSRVGDPYTIVPTNISFSCYNKDGVGPWTKTPTSVSVEGLDADRVENEKMVGSTADRIKNSDWKVVSVKYNSSSVSGSCGTANGQSLESAPSGGELCKTGLPSGVNGSGPWSWTCKSYDSEGFTGKSASCSASLKAPTCPPVTVSCCPLGDGYLDVNVSGIGSGRVNATEGMTDNGGVMQYHAFGSCHYTNYYDKAKLAACIATNYVKGLNGFSNMSGSCTLSNPGDVISPLKVNLAGGDAVMNKVKPTVFYLTQKDGRIMRGLAKGGLNPAEGWLMVHRDGGPLVYRDGALNADNWFGDRDLRTVNGYTDLAETFKDFLDKDEYEQRYIPLRALGAAEKAAKLANASENKGRITDPSFDLRVLDAANVERFASDFFNRIYVDYRVVQEGDGPRGEVVNNVILERGVVRTHSNENHAAVDQWLVLHQAKGSADSGATYKILPPGSKPSY